MKTFKYFLLAGIITSALLSSCRETDEVLHETVNLAEPEIASADEEPKDPPKDPPKDRDNWKLGQK